jgi:hypothetical protein
MAIHHQAQQCSAGLCDDRSTLVTAEELYKANAVQILASWQCKVGLGAAQMLDIFYP